MIPFDQTPEVNPPFKKNGETLPLFLEDDYKTPTKITGETSKVDGWYILVQESYNNTPLPAHPKAIPRQRQLSKESPFF